MSNHWQIGLFAAAALWGATGSAIVLRDWFETKGRPAEREEWYWELFIAACVILFWPALWLLFRYLDWRFRK